MTFNLCASQKNLTRRFEVRLSSPNPLFERWLEEWRLDAVARDLEIQHVFRKALVSLRKFPTTLKSGMQCMILENFGPKLCLKLDQKLAEYRKRFPNGEYIKRPKSPEIVIKSKVKTGSKRKSLMKTNYGEYNFRDNPLLSESAEVAEKIVVSSRTESADVAIPDSSPKILQSVDLVGIVDTNSEVDGTQSNRKEIPLPDGPSRIQDVEGKIHQRNELSGTADNFDELFNLSPGEGTNPNDDRRPLTSITFNGPDLHPAKRKGRPYVPTKGSGAYALLIALHDHRCRFGVNGLSKAELKKEAQGLCDVPFDQRLPGSHYTAWSAMGQLCKKLLVIKVGCPAKYLLTEKGVELAEKLKSATAEINSINDSKNSTEQMKNGFATEFNSHNDNVNSAKQTKSRFAIETNSISSGINLAMPNSAFVNINNSVFFDNVDPKTSCKIDFNKPCVQTKVNVPQVKKGSASTRSLRNYQAHTFSSTDDEDDYDSDIRKLQEDMNNMHDMLNEMSKDHLGDKSANNSRTIKPKRKPSCTIVRPPSEEQVLKSDKMQAQNEPTLSELKAQNKVLLSELQLKMEEDRKRLGKLLTPVSKKTCEEKVTFPSSRISSEETHGNIGLENLGQPYRWNEQEEDMFRVLSQKSGSNEPSCSSGSQNTLKTSQSSVSSTQEDFEMIMYRTILLIDTAETQGRTDGERIRMVLTKMSVDYEICHLKVGDYTWVCRDLGGHELILPYIIERKRLDDFSKSIKDGRFHEQKFRLKSAPLKQRIYIIENYGNGYRGGIPLSTLMQAASNAQLIDGYTIKFTKDRNHTLRYLAALTRKFTNLLNGKVLKSYFGNELPHFSWNDNVLHLMTFKDFMKNANKKKKFTVREMFIRHLLQLHGISVEKAKAIVDKYPCPRLLLESYLYGTGDQNSLSKIKVGRLERSVGAVISKSIHSLYSKEKFS